MGFSLVKHHFWGTPMTMESPIYVRDIAARDGSLDRKWPCEPTVPTVPTVPACGTSGSVGIWGTHKPWWVILAICEPWCWYGFTCMTGWFCSGKCWHIFQHHGTCGCCLINMFHVKLFWISFFRFPMAILGHTLCLESPMCGSKELCAAVETRQPIPESLYDTMMDTSGNKRPVCRSWLIS